MAETSVSSVEPPDAPPVDAGKTVENRCSATGMAVCRCGVDLPVTWANIELARLHRNWHKISTAFNRLFYVLLKGRGVDHHTGNREIALLLKHIAPDHLNLTKPQARGAYGLEHKVYWRSGRLRGVKAKENDVEEEEDGESPVLGFTEEDWPLVVDEALMICGRLPEQVDVQDEVRWVMSKAREWPDFCMAPSQMAVKAFLALNDPKGVSPLERDFLNMLWSKRMAPGDKKAKAAVFQEDKAGEGSCVEHDAEMEKRLFGS